MGLIAGRGGVVFCLLLWLTLLPGTRGQNNADSLQQKLLAVPEAQRPAIYQQLSNALADSDPAEGLRISTEGIVLSRKTGDRLNEALLLNSRGQHYYHFGEYTKAIDDFEASLAISKEGNNRKGIAYSLNNLGNVHSDISNYQEALQFYLDALKILQELHDSLAIGSLYTNVGSLYGALGYPEKELEYYQLSLSIAERMNNLEVVSITLENMGVVYSEAGEYGSAEQHLRKAIAISQQIGDRHGIAECQGALAELYFKQGAWEKGEQLFAASINSAKAIGDKRLMCENYANLAGMYEQRKQFGKVKDAATTALGLATELNHLPLLQRTYGLLARWAVAAGDYKTAYQHYTQYEKYKDSLYAAQKTRTINELEIKFQVERRKREITFLREKNTQQQALLDSERQLRAIYTFLFFVALGISVFVYRSYLQRRRNEEALVAANLRLKEQEKDLRALNAAKDKLFSIIAHDLRSPLFIITGLSDILREEYPDGDTAQTKKLITELNTKAHATSGLLETLLDWGRSQSDGISISKQPVGVRAAVEDCATVFAEPTTLKHITLHNAADGAHEVFVDRDMLLIVLRNLISNAIKFSHPGGSVTVNTHDHGSTISIRVADTGTGIAQERLAKLFDITTHNSTRGTQNEKGSGLGLLLCKDFIERNGGTITAESVEGAGSTFTCTLPKPTENG